MPRLRATKLAQETSTRDRILDAAEALFSKRGYAGVGLAEVAETVGVGKSSLFHHFANKPELYAAVAGRILRRIEERAVRSLALGGDPVERLERVLDELVDVLAAHPTYARLLLRALFEDDDLSGDNPQELEAQAAVTSVITSLTGLLREGMASGRFRAASLPHLVLSLVGVVVFPFASGDFGTEVLGKDLFDPAEVRRRKREIRDLLRLGLVPGRA